MSTAAPGAVMHRGAQDRASTIHEMERSILGQIVLFPDAALAVAVPILRDGSAMVGHGHQKIYQAAIKLGTCCDLSTLSNDLTDVVKPSDLSSLLNGEISWNPERLEYLCNKVLLEHRRRELEKAGVKLVQALKSGTDPDVGLQDFTKRVDALPLPKDRSATSVPTAFMAADRGYRDLLEDSRLRPKPILGDGLLYPRQIAQLHGTDGSRKSWALLHLVVANATGTDWFGIPTRPGGVRVGLISLEDDVWLLKERIAAIVMETGADETLLETNLRLIYPPDFDHRLDLLLGENRRAVGDWVKKHDLELVVIDHLSRTHNLEPRDLHSASAAALEIARSCSCAIVFAHHDRKRSQGTRGRDQDASLGSALFRADCRLSAHIFEVKPGTLCLHFEKSTACSTPEQIWLLQEDGGGGVLKKTDPPTKRSDQKRANMERLLDLIREAGKHGLAPGCVHEDFGVAPDTLSRYAKELVKEGKIRRVGRTDQVRWIAISELADGETSSDDDRKSA